MFGLDELISHTAHEAPVFAVIAAAILLGVLHAGEPDHLAAVTSLIAGERRHGVRRAAALGLSWGAGHATTLSLLGLPVVLFNSHLPERLRTASEIAVGCVVIILALRLLRRWRVGVFHAHLHRNADGGTHRHLHPHGEASGHDHEHASSRTRSNLSAYAIGLLHGFAGSAGVAVLLLASIQGRSVAAFSLIVSASCTAAAMAVLSTAFGYVLVRGPFGWSLRATAPVLGSASLVFGTSYLLAAAGVAYQPF